MIMTPEDIKLEIQEELMVYEPDVTRVRVEAFLAGLRDNEQTIAAVYNEARDLAHARHREFVTRQRDMERVVAVFDACIEPMIAWLEANGLDNARRHVFGKRAWASSLTDNDDPSRTRGAAD